MIEHRGLDVPLQSGKLIDQRLLLSSDRPLAKGLEVEEGILLTWQIVVLVTASGVVWLKTALFGRIPSDDDQGVKVESRALLPIDLVVSIGIEGIVDTVVVLAVGGQGNHIGCHLEHQACR